MAVMIKIIDGNASDDSELLEGRTEKYMYTPFIKPPDALIWRKKMLIVYFFHNTPSCFKSQLPGKYLIFVGRRMYTSHNGHRLFVLKGGNSSW